MSYILIYIIIVFPLAFTHDVIARRLGKMFSQSIFSNDENETYWTIVDRVKQRRAYIITILIFLISSITYLAYQLFEHTTYSYDTGIFKDFWYSLGIFIVAYIFLEIFSQYKTPSDNNESASRDKIQKILENLSITAGIEPPKLIMYAGNMPKLFLHLTAVGTPQLHVSTSFLQHFSNSEAEAYIAHEIGHYLSNEVTTKRTVEWLITVLKIVGLVTFLFLLGIVHPSLPTIWLIIYATLVARMFFDKNRPLKRYVDAKFIFLVMNPVHLAVVLISGVIHYTMNYGETIYADLKALELTRYPQALYSALSKLLIVATDETYQKFAYYSPFFLQNTTEKDESFEQHLIEDRLRLVRSFDQTVTDSHSPLKLLTCSVCDHTLTEIDVVGPYDMHRKAWACNSCGHLWFDKGSFYALSSVDTKDYFEKYSNSDKSKGYKQPPYSCPRCLVPLFKMHDKSIPKHILVYPCSSCRGNLTSTDDFLSYTQYRLSLSQKTSRRV